MLSILNGDSFAARTLNVGQRVQGPGPKAVVELR